MKKIDYQKSPMLSAWTLPELLLVMVLTGILFLSALDGLDLLKRFMFHLVQETGYTYELQKNWELLDRILAETDSIITENDDFFLCRRGCTWMVLERKGPYLICRKKERTDTLFHTVISSRFIPSAKKKYTADSLYVTLTVEGRTYPFAFGLKPLLP